MKYKSMEVYAFPRSFFPVDRNGHEIHLLHNDAHKTVDDRFQIHLTLHCPRCDEDRTVRGRLPPEITDHSYRAALAKVIVLGYFNNECTGRPHHSYYGP